MKIRERADRVAADLTEILSIRNRELLALDIAEAISAAVRQEREECAKVCDDEKDSWGTGSIVYALRVCGDAIRKRSSGKH